MNVNNSHTNQFVDTFILQMNRLLPTVQHISDMHSKFTLRPHHVWKYGRHPIADRWH